jgi:hypothetical protein
MKDPSTTSNKEIIESTLATGSGTTTAVGAPNT